MDIASNKKKIFNDPIYGFISVQYDIILDVINHPFFQRLRRIEQLGLTHYVYPGALHTRFHHAIGCTHLMQKAVMTLRSKGHIITNEEAEAVTLAILLHDVGHGPYSHALEHSIVAGINHEELSVLIMKELNRQFGGRLSLAIEIFQDRYTKKFLHQLVSSQLDVDRLDYLKRDSFYTGVSEGAISSDRIIDMLDVENDNLVVQGKGVYSIEKFIVARRLMYWQVYLHKTVIAAEFLLIKILSRARFLAENQVPLFGSPPLQYFLQRNYNKSDFESGPEVLQQFLKLDDYDLMGAIKQWAVHDDVVLSRLCSSVVNRTLPTLELKSEPYEEQEIERKKIALMQKYDLSASEAEYLVFSDGVVNNAYDPTTDRINLKLKDGSLLDIAEASDNFNIQTLAVPITKFFLCYPKH